MQRRCLIFLAFFVFALQAQLSPYDLVRLTRQESGSLIRIDARLSAMSPTDPQRNELNTSRAAVIRKALSDRRMVYSTVFADPSDKWLYCWPVTPPPPSVAPVAPSVH